MTQRNAFERWAGKSDRNTRIAIGGGVAPAGCRGAGYRGRSGAGGVGMSAGVTGERGACMTCPYAGVGYRCPNCHEDIAIVDHVQRRMDAAAKQMLSDPSVRAEMDRQAIVTAYAEISRLHAALREIADYSEPWAAQRAEDALGLSLHPSPPDGPGRGCAAFCGEDGTPHAPDTNSPSATKRVGGKSTLGDRVP